jgi:hypothetical protein
MTPDLQKLADQATKNTDAEDAAAKLLGSLSAMIAAAKNDPVAIQAIADNLKAHGDALAEAVVANTPAATP